MTLVGIIYVISGFLSGSILLTIATDGRVVWGPYEPNFIEKTIFFFVIIVLCPITLTVILLYLVSDYISKKEANRVSSAKDSNILPL
jgi:hypothetical protein